MARVNELLLVARAWNRPPSVTRAEDRADLALAFTPDQKLDRQHWAGFGGVENTVVKFVSYLGFLKQSKTLAQFSPRSLPSR